VSPARRIPLTSARKLKDAELIINGITAITSSSNTVTSAIPGLTLTLNKEAPGTNVTVKVAADYSEAQKAVQAFVDQYNSVMAFIQDKLKYNKDTNTKGDLFADPVLQGIQSRLRSMVASTLNNPTEPFKILAQIGISTSAVDFGKSAALKFDTAKFMEAMEENPESVANLLGAPAGGVEPFRESTGEQKAQGLANIMREYLHPMVMYAGTLDETQKGYERQIYDLKKQIEAFTDRVAAYAERTRLRFSILKPS
jgi:flagellar hook-associated protein 2